MTTAAGGSSSLSRCLDHLEYEENLYDFMRSQIPFYLATSNAHLNHFALNESRGLEKQDVLNLYYNDPLGKRELLNELMLSALLPKQWGQGTDGGGVQKDLPQAQEMGAVLIDVQGQFSAYKFIERVRACYDAHQLYETVGDAGPAGGGDGGQSKAETEDKHAFIKQVLSGLYVFKVFSAVEFNLTVRSLANFLKTHKNIGLVVVDGLHLIENVEIYSVKNSDKYGSSSAAAQGLGSGGPGKPGKRGAANNVQAMAAQNDIPTSDDFFGTAGANAGGTPQSKAIITTTP